MNTVGVNLFSRLNIVVYYKRNSILIRKTFYISCKNNNLEMMRLLLVCGADPNLADIAGVRPLDWLPVDVKDEIETLYADLSSKDVWRPGIDKLI